MNKPKKPTAFNNYSYINVIYPKAKGELKQKKN